MADDMEKAQSIYMALTKVTDRDERAQIIAVALAAQRKGIVAWHDAQDKQLRDEAYAMRAANAGSQSALIRSNELLFSAATHHNSGRAIEAHKDEETTDVS